jgi:deoxyribose-phosphate aldolase
MDHGQATVAETVPAAPEPLAHVHDGTPLAAYDDLAQRIVCLALDAAVTDEEVVKRAAHAVELRAGMIAVRPSDLDQVARVIDAPTRLAAACAYPYGFATTSAKLFEARDAIRRGAQELFAVLNIGKLNTRHFQYVEMELIQLAQACHESAAKLTVIFASPLLTEEGKLVGAKICKRSEVDRALASTRAVAPADEDLLIRKCHPFVQVTGYAETLDSALAGFARGFDRVVTPFPAEVLGEWRRRLKERDDARRPGEPSGA